MNQNFMYKYHKMLKIAIILGGKHNFAQPIIRKVNKFGNKVAWGKCSIYTFLRFPHILLSKVYTFAPAPESTFFRSIIGSWLITSNRNNCCDFVMAVHKIHHYSTPQCFFTALNVTDKKYAINSVYKKSLSEYKVNKEMQCK